MREMCCDCGQRSVALGSDKRLCQACEIAHIEDARFLEEIEDATFAIQMARGLGLSGHIVWT